MATKSDQKITIKTIVIVAAILFGLALSGFVGKKLIYDLLHGGAPFLSWPAIMILSVITAIVATIAGYTLFKKDDLE